MSRHFSRRRPAYARTRSRGFPGSSGRPSLLRRIVDWAAAIAIVLLLGSAVIGLNEFAGADLEGVPTVSDGDSLVLDGERIRLRGIDAPELDQTCRRDGERYACGRAARSRLQDLIGTQKITCSGTETDQYGRRLATCEAGEVELNSAMVEAGWAVAYGSYVTEQLQARAAGRGLWEGDFDRPQDWRAGDQGRGAEDGGPGLLENGAAFLRQMLRGLLRLIG